MIEFSSPFAIRLFALLLAFMSAQATAAPLAATVRWKDPSSMQLNVDFPGNGYHASWQLYRCTCGDLLIRSELMVPGEVTHGDILLVVDRAVLTRGFGPADAGQISVDAPALMMQLAMSLLERAEPAGPAAISQSRQVDVEDKINYINLDTGSVAGSFPAPWSVKGTIWPQAESQRRFDLVFVFNAAGAAGGTQQQAQMKLAGVAEYAASEFPLAADTGLNDWALSWRDKKDPAAAKAKRAGTLAELRRVLRKTRPK